LETNRCTKPTDNARGAFIGELANNMFMDSPKPMFRDSVCVPPAAGTRLNAASGIRNTASSDAILMSHRQVISTPEPMTNP